MIPPPPARSAGPGRVVALILGAALVGGVVAGLVIARSGDDDSGPTGRVTIPAGWTTHNLTAEGFRLGLPPEWKDVPPGQVDSALDDLREDNPDLAELIESQLAGSLSSLVRFFAFDTRSPTLAEEFATNVNVVVEPLPGGVDFDEYLDANLRQLRQVPGVTVSAENERVQLPGGRAGLIKSQFTLNTPGGPRQIAVTQYVLLRSDRGFILSMTTTPMHESTYVPLWDRIARTFAPL